MLFSSFPAVIIRYISVENRHVAIAFSRFRSEFERNAFRALGGNRDLRSSADMKQEGRENCDGDKRQDPLEDNRPDRSGKWQRYAEPTCHIPSSGKCFQVNVTFCL